MGASGGIGPVGGTAAAAGRYNGHAMLPQQLHYPGRQGHLALARNLGALPGCVPPTHRLERQPQRWSIWAEHRETADQESRRKPVQPGAVLRTSRRRDGW